MTTPRRPRDTSRTCETCGWTSKITTQGLADKALRIHSCEKKRRYDAEAARARARESRIDRTPKPCAHKIANHQHGTYACYVLDYCRCLPCAVAAGQYESQRVRDHRYGRWDHLVDAEPVRAHITHLAASGVGLKTVARRSGVAHGALWKLVYGKKGSTPSKRVRHETAEAILALPLGDKSAADHARVTSIGTARRLQALIACGWSVNQIAARSGLDRQRLDGALRGRDVYADTARRVKTLYDELWDEPPPEHDHRTRIAASRARKRAQVEGWLPPMAWDDDSIDDPAASPEVAPIVRPGVGRPRRAVVHVDDVEWLIRAGGTRESISARLGIAPQTLDYALRRDGRIDLVRRLSQAAAS